MKRFVCLTLASTLALGTLTGCSSNATQETTKAAAATTEAAKVEASTTGGEVTESTGSLILPDPTTFSVFLVNAGQNRVFDSEWAAFKAIGDNTNIYLESVVPKSNSDREAAFNMMISSGELADIIAWNDATAIEQLGRDGGLIPLNDLIKEYAPNIQNLIDTNPAYAQVAYSLDGNIYQIPRLQELFTAEYWWIRQDWLDNLGLEIPTTVDELYDVLTAFRNDDPNGNGLKDEIPLFDRAGHKMPDEYLYLWDTSTGFYEHDGKMVFEPLEDNFKTGVENLSKWYEEGLIDPEIFTRGTSSRDTLFAGDLGAVTHDWVSTAGYNSSLAEDIPGFNVVPMAPPANQHGEITERTCRQPNIGWGISSQCEDPVSVMKYFDYCYSEEGTEYLNYGIEGDTYTKNADGTIEYTEAVLTAKEGSLNYLSLYGINADIGRYEPAQYEYKLMAPEAIDATELYNKHPEWYNTMAPPYRDGEMNLKLIPEDESEYLKIMASIDAYVDESFQGWLLGTSDFEADYDGFIAELKNRGIERAVEIVQASYDLQY